MFRIKGSPKNFPFEIRPRCGKVWCNPGVHECFASFFSRVHLRPHSVCLYEYNKLRAAKRFPWNLMLGKYYGYWSRNIKFSIVRTALEIIFSKVRVVFLCISPVWLAKQLWRQKLLSTYKLHTEVRNKLYFCTKFLTVSCDLETF